MFVGVDAGFIIGGLLFEDFNNRQSERLFWAAMVYINKLLATGQFGGIADFSTPLQAKTCPNKGEKWNNIIHMML